jgi:hypothetical protein
LLNNNLKGEDMKRKNLVIVVIVFGLMGLSAMGQNLVPNGSFEIYDTCPSGNGQINYATGWSSYCATPDYFNPCNNTTAGVPINFVGYQNAEFGVSYAGLFTYARSGFYREILGIQLIQSLIIGQKYFVKFYTNMALLNNVSIATNKMGIRFSTIPYSYNNPVPIDNFAHVYSDSIITDTLNWIKISGSFIADSTYQYVSVGNFFNDSTTTHVLMDTSGWFAYYYIDNIIVSTDSSFETGINVISTIPSLLLSPNPFTTSTILTLQGTYHNPSLFIYNLLGQEVRSIPVGTNSQLTINREHLASGMYFYKLIDENKEVLGIGKMVIQ